MVTIEDAKILAQKIKEQSPKVQSIELFGSTLKRGKGHDVDFILTVEDGLWKQFWAIRDDINPRWPARLMTIRRLIKKLAPSLDNAFMEGRKNSRQLRASKLIELDLAKLGEGYRPGTVIDVWLMPHGWHSSIEDITDNYNMRMLLKEAARSAIKIA